jgi:Protein of unknown function (DUF4232)
MNGTDFDVMTRRFATRLSRRRMLNLTAIGAVSALSLKLGQTESFAQSDASALFQRFYENVNAYQYKQAYALLGSKWHSQQSLQNFTNGYSNTAFVQCKTTGETASGNSTVVSVKLISWHNDEKIVGYTGHYTVGEENGQLTILGGNNTLTAAPTGTPPLCKIDELSLSIGSWNGAAGSRISSIVGMNESDHTCVLGGSPRVTLIDEQGHVLISTSEEGSPPTAIHVSSGKSAEAPLSFSNWCGDTGNPASLRAQVPGDTATGDVSHDVNGISYPPCNGPGQAAHMAIKGWATTPS